LISTKVAGPSRNLSWIRNGPPALDRANIRAAIDGSLQRLQTDYVDLYQLHWPERNQPMFGQWKFEPQNDRECTPREQLEALAELVQEGKVRQIGVSNEHPGASWNLPGWQMNSACRALLDKTPTACSTGLSKPVWWKSVIVKKADCSPIPRWPWPSDRQIPDNAQCARSPRPASLWSALQQAQRASRRPGLCRSSSMA
jgi:hypothetical protein